MSRWPLGMALVLSSLITGCSDSYEDQVGKLEKFTNGNKIGGSSDVWLVKLNAFGQYEKVSLVFGFMDDYAFCTEVSQAYMNLHPLDQYSCSFAN